MRSELPANRQAVETPLVTYFAAEEFQTYEIPDFVALFGDVAHKGDRINSHGPSSSCVIVDCQDCVAVEAGMCFECSVPASGCATCSAPLGPRSAMHVAAAAGTMADTFAERIWDAAQWELSAEFDGELPPATLRFLERVPEAEAALWLARYEAAMRGVELRLNAGQQPVPRCTAEEMALFLALQLGSLWLEEQALLEDGALAAAYPSEDPERRLNRLGTAMAHELTVLAMFNQAQDGIELGEYGEYADDAVNLHPRDWFLPFEEEDAADLELLLGFSPGELRFS